MKHLIFYFKLSLILVLLFPIFLHFSFFEKSLTLFSQTKGYCNEQLNKAQQEYNLGNFQKAIDLIEPCLKKSDISESEKGKAYRLLGLVYIGQQLRKEANEAVRNLLLMVPNYKINPETDPPQLKEIIDKTAPTLVPKIDSISPNTMDRGENGFIMIIKGSNFVYGTVVRFNGIKKSTTFENTKELRAEILPNDILKEGEYNVNVYSPIMGGKISNTLIFNVKKVSSFPWTWIAIGGGAVLAGGTTVLLLLKKGNETNKVKIGAPPARP